MIQNYEDKQKQRQIRHIFDSMGLCGCGRVNKYNLVWALLERAESQGSFYDPLQVETFDEPLNGVAVLNLLIKVCGRAVIVSGGCKQGGDRFAEILSVKFDCPKIIHYPDKSKLDTELLKVNSRAAYTKINYARNALVARDAKDYLIACVAPDRKGGTEDTIKRWKKLHPELPEGRLILV